MRTSQDDLPMRPVTPDNFLKRNRAFACVQIPAVGRCQCSNSLVATQAHAGDVAAARIFALIFRGFAGGRHLHEARVEGGAYFDEVSLVGHDLIDVFVDHRNFVETGRQ